MRIAIRSCVAPAAVAFLLSCGGSPPPGPTFAELPSEPLPEAEETDESTTGDESDEPEGQPVGTTPKPFRELDHEGKMAFMKEVVTPRMRAVFQEFDSKEFETFGCDTCHGPGAKEGKYGMPSGTLDVLDPTNNFAKHQKKYSKELEFMIKKVVPEMATLLAEPAYDPGTGQGFGCFHCHTMAKKK